MKKLKLAIWGYGKMGKMVENIALQRGHIVPLIIDTDSVNLLNASDFGSIDVVIEFTNPEFGFDNVSRALHMGASVVTGTTGWVDRQPEAIAIADKSKVGLIVASNFSLGVNILFEANKILAKYLSHRDEYKVSIEEIHHTGKKDAPSGTAITLADGIISAGQYKAWSMVENKNGIIPIHAKRIDPAPGTHTVTYTSPIDTISITHEAHNREGFALGAVIAAEFLAGKQGFFTMSDVLGF